jgi:hypothetical protein
MTLEMCHKLKVSFQKNDDFPTMTNEFNQFILALATNWTPSSYAAPYTTIIQGSGSGKSFLMKQMAKKHFTFFACLRSKGSDGYPPRSQIAQTLTHPGKWMVKIHYCQMLCGLIWATLGLTQLPKPH